jgi:hypothetical protein
MNQIHIQNLEKLIAFSEHLKSFNDKIEDEFSSMKAHSQAIHDDWNDQQYDAFITDFDEAAQGMRKYLSHHEAHEGFLNRLIERAIALRDTHM